MGESAGHCGRHLEYRCKYCEKYHAGDYHEDDGLTSVEYTIMHGAVVFTGTRVPAVQVIEMFRNQISGDEIANDYPMLTQQQFDYAQFLAKRSHQL